MHQAEAHRSHSQNNPEPARRSAHRLPNPSHTATSFRNRSPRVCSKFITRSRLSSVQCESSGGGTQLSRRVFIKCSGSPVLPGTTNRPAPSLFTVLVVGVYAVHSFSPSPLELLQVPA